ncbi:MAG: RNA polymerase sigma factor [Thioalkalivibrio sp.]
MAAAKYRAIDHLRRRRLLAEKHEQLGHELDLAHAPDGADTGPDLDDPVGDDLLRLIFTACHPVLSTDARVALTLKLLCGLSTDEIACAFLAAEPTVAQRTLAEARVPFELPPGPELGTRLASVLEVIYLVFNEGYAATRGEDWMRPGLCDEALRLGRILAQLAPGEPEVHGLVALMEIQSSRLHARTTSSGEPILLLDQDRGRWDPLLIRRGLAALKRSETLGGTLGPYALQAAIAACHARARTAGEPTGAASRPCTIPWPRSRPRRWWSSTGPWRWVWPSVRRQVWWWRHFARSRGCNATHCCPVCVVTCCRSWADMKKPVKRSARRRA